MEFEKIKPMLAELGNKEYLSKHGWIGEPKIDGTRLMCYKQGKNIKFLNRRGIWITRYPELNDIWKNIKANCILDGELTIFDKKGKPNFYLLTEREHIGNQIRIEILSKKMPATYVVFDILNLNGKNLMTTPLIKRKRILEKIISDSERIKKCYYTDNMKRLWDVVKKMGLEGIMIKKIDSPYLQKRSDLWLKIKTLKTLDTIVCGYTEGEKARKGYFGALLCGVYYNKKLKYIGRVGTGFDTKQLKDYIKILKKLKTKKNPFDEFEEEPEILRKICWVKPELVAEVRFMNLTSNLKMRAPALKHLRDDKTPRECILDKNDIKNLMI